MWSDTKTPWKDLAERYRSNQCVENEVACNWEFPRKTVGFTNSDILEESTAENGNGKRYSMGSGEGVDQNTAFRKPFTSAFTPAENTLTPVAKVERYKNGFDSYVTRRILHLLLFKRRYRPLRLPSLQKKSPTRRFKFG